MLWRSVFTNDEADTGAMPAIPTGQSGDNAAAIADFETWLKTQTAEIQTAYALRMKNLEGALNAEREARKAIEKAQKEAKKNAEDAEAKKLAEVQDFQKLAEVRAARITELEAETAQVKELQERASRMEKALKAQLQNSRVNVPAHITALLDKLDIVDQLEYLAQNAAVLQAPVVAAPALSGIPATPAPNGNGKLPDEEKRRRAFQPKL